MPGTASASSIIRARDPDDGEELLAVSDLEGLLALVQASVLEIHVWGAKLDDIERPDGITFDLDPDAGGGAGRDVVAAAFEVRDRLKATGLRQFVKTTGGKGLHVYTPAQAACGLGRGEGRSRTASPRPWPRTARANIWPPPRRQRAARRIFVDYLRNGRGATAVVAYSARARAGAAVSTPLAWDELGPEMRPDRFTVLNLLHRLAHIDDPWKDMRRKARRLPA